MEATNRNKTRIYEIRVEGYLDSRRIKELGDLQVNLLPDGQTLISGPVVDQAALFGILIRIRDMGIPLVSVISKSQAGHEENRRQ